MVVDRRRALLIGSPIAAVIVLLVLAQLILPGIAENRVRSEIEDDGTVESVEVSSFPAVKLLFGKADEIKVHVGEYRPSAGADRIAELIERSRDVGKVDARLDQVRVGPVVLRDVRFHAEDGAATGEASVSDADIRAATPPGLGLRPVVAATDAIVLEASVGAFGLQAGVQARVAATDGAITVAPEGGLGSLLGGVATLTVFADPRVQVTRVGAVRRGDGYRVSADAQIPG